VNFQCCLFGKTGLKLPIPKEAIRKCRTRSFIVNPPSSPATHSAICTQWRVLSLLLLLTLYHLKNSFSDAQVLLIPLLSRTLPNLASASARQPSRYCPIPFSTHPSS
ncbi:unnamed protein product, partial [Prunus brigantina]